MNARSRQQHFLPRNAAQLRNFERGNLVCKINNDLTARGYAPLTQDQIECLCDGTRAEEARAMLDHLIMRCDLYMFIADDAARFIDACEGTL